MGLILSFLLLLLHIAVIVFVAYCIVWLFKWLNWAIDGNVYKWGQVIVVLLIIIAVVNWLASVFFGFASPLPTMRVFR